MRTHQYTPQGIAYERAGRGDGTPIVLIHAGVADRTMWDAQWEALAAEYEVVRLDLRGFGESSRPPGARWSHAEDVLSALEHLGITRCHLVAGSLGAGVATEAALSRPGLAVSLLLCPPGGSLLAESTEDLERFFEAEKNALAARDLDAAVEANIATWVVGRGREPSDVASGVQDHVRRMQWRAFEVTESLGETDEAEFAPPAFERLPDLTIPVLVLVGGRDLDTTLDSAERICRALPDARRVDWPDVAHLPSLERPDDFLALLREWVAQER
ncbi:alpha/beta fold hydrolase [Actinoallomurus sp. CA-142502]|uniref:alpha/beta fold hydrolase n=1 Tax=Actinoallomurus sp. CA-142502 TaxID=3239885 RepID=UPI003D8F27A6